MAANSYYRGSHNFPPPPSFATSGQPPPYSAIAPQTAVPQHYTPSPSQQQHLSSIHRPAGSDKPYHSSNQAALLVQHPPVYSSHASPSNAHHGEYNHPSQIYQQQQPQQSSLYELPSAVYHPYSPQPQHHYESRYDTAAVPSGTLAVPSRRHSHQNYSHGHQQHHRSRSPSHTRSRSSHTTRDSLFGAGAGGLIGDLIFPGMGTLGGALLGGLGGNSYSKRKSKEKERDREGWEAWNARHGHERNRTRHGRHRQGRSTSH